MELNDAVSILRGYNKWRRGDENYTQPDPRVIGQAIDAVVDHFLNTTECEKPRHEPRHGVVIKEAAK